jgi:tetratricopeptide (TPR) repeat protein
MSIARHLLTTASRRGPSAAPCTLLCALVACAVALPFGAHAQDTPRGLTLELGNVRSAVDLVERDLERVDLRERRFPVAKRYVEATLAYGRSNLELAGVLLLDLVRDKAFQRSPDYYEGLYMLGNSMYRLRNYNGAKRYLDLVIQRAGGPRFQDALEQLVDIAIRVRRYDEVARYASMLKSVPSSGRRSELVYQFGRSYLVTSNYAEAKRFFSEIRPGERRYPHALFYLGAIAAHVGQLDEAAQSFRRVIEEGKSGDERTRAPSVVVSFANLGLARILLSRGKYDEAIDAYQSVDRTASVYDEALFELAAANMAKGKPRDALTALDILLLSVNDDSLAVRAAVLRGRINMSLRDYDAADVAYKEVVDEFSAISGELDRFAGDDTNLRKYFSWLLNRGTDDGGAVRPVSKRVADYLQRDEDMTRVVQVFDDMAREKRNVREADKLARTIESTLARSARLDMFPPLKDAWMKLAEADNRVVDIGRRAVELIGDRGTDALQADERIAAESLKARRAKLEQVFGKMPATATAYKKRKSRIDKAFQRLQAEVGEMRAALGLQRDELQALEKLANDRQFGSGGFVLPPEVEAQVRKSLAFEKDELRRAYRMVDQLEELVQIDASAVGAGDEISRDERKVRAALLSVQRKEQEIYAGALSREGREREAIGLLATLRDQVEAMSRRVRKSYIRVEAMADERVGAMLKQLGDEQRRIANYKVRVSGYERDARRLASSVGYGLLRQAQRRLSDVVLEADLGMVDVAWARKQKKAAEKLELQEQRAKKVGSLQEVMDALTDTSGEGGEL